MDTRQESVRSHAEALLPHTSLQEHSPGQLTQHGCGPSRPTHTCGAVFGGRRKHRDAALFWCRFGFRVIPVQPKSKYPACPWDDWLTKLSTSRITQHWTEHPDHEVGFIVGNDYVVMDADGERAVRSLYDAERRYGMVPLLIVKTARGEHHYFKKDSALPCKTTSWSAEDDDRIDVKTGRTMVVLAPSTNKVIVKMGESSMLQHASQLSVASKEFLEYFGAVKPIHAHSAVSQVSCDDTPAVMRLIATGLKHFDADCDYDTWLRVGAIAFHESQGSAEGFQCFDGWSATGKKYKGVHDTKAKWRSFRLNHPHPVTIATFRRMLAQQGHDWAELCAEATGEKFELINEGNSK